MKPELHLTLFRELDDGEHKNAAKMSKKRAHVIHPVTESGSGESRGGTLRKRRKVLDAEGLFGSLEGAEEFGHVVCTNPMGSLKASVIMIIALRVSTTESECTVGSDPWIKICTEAFRVRPGGKKLRVATLGNLFRWLDKARMMGTDLVAEGKVPMMECMREDVGCNKDEVDYLWKLVFQSIFMCAASASRSSHAQVHTPSAKDMLNFSLIQGASELIGHTNGTVTTDLAFDQLVDRALKLKEMGKIKDFGL